MIYGAGGVGKSSLLELLKQVGLTPTVADIEEGTSNLDIDRIEPTPQTWDELRTALQTFDLWGDAVCIDSFTKAEELATAWTLANVPHEKGHLVYRIEDYGFGKGYTHVYETFLQLLGDLDALCRRGKHVICTAHELTQSVPNPMGEDWLQYQPSLQSPPKQGKIRERVKEWSDHLIHVGFDSYVKDGKASGGGTRTINVSELPTFWAKTRTLPPEPMPFTRDDASLWRALFQGENT